MIDWLIRSLILAYQRWLSPRKGFSCAHRVLHGGESCSDYALQVLQTDGSMRLLPLMRQRFRDCAQACISLRTQIGTTAISYESYPSPELPPEPPEEPVPTKADWYGDQRAAERYARSGFDDEGERAVRCCAELTFASPRGCIWHLSR